MSLFHKPPLVYIGFCTGHVGGVQLAGKLTAAWVGSAEEAHPESKIQRGRDHKINDFHVVVFHEFELRVKLAK